MTALRFGFLADRLVVPVAGVDFNLLLTSSGKVGGAALDAILIFAVDMAKSMINSKPIRASSPIRPCLCSKRIRKSNSRKVYCLLSTVVGILDVGEASDNSDTEVALDNEAWDEHCDKVGRALRCEEAGGEERGDPSFWTWRVVDIFPS